MSVKTNMINISVNISNYINVHKSLTKTIWRKKIWQSNERDICVFIYHKKTEQRITRVLLDVYYNPSKKETRDTPNTKKNPITTTSINAMLSGIYILCVLVPKCNATHTDRLYICNISYESTSPACYVSVHCRRNLCQCIP